MKKVSSISWIAMTLLIIGGLNWALVGIFSFDFIAFLLGELSILSRIVYVLVGLSALYMMFTSCKMCKK